MEWNSNWPRISWSLGPIKILWLCVNISTAVNKKNVSHKYAEKDVFGALAGPVPSVLDKFSCMCGGNLAAVTGTGNMNVLSTQSPAFLLPSISKTQTPRTPRFLAYMHHLTSEKSFYRINLYIMKYIFKYPPH